MSEELRHEFQSNGLELSRNASFITQREEGNWRIENGDSQIFVKKEENGLGVYSLRLQQKCWYLDDEDDDRGYLITNEDGKLNVYSVPGNDK